MRDDYCDRRIIQVVLKVVIFSLLAAGCNNHSALSGSSSGTSIGNAAKNSDGNRAIEIVNPSIEITKQLAKIDPTNLESTARRCDELQAESNNALKNAREQNSGNELARKEAVNAAFDAWRNKMLGELSVLKDSRIDWIVTVDSVISEGVFNPIQVVLLKQPSERFNLVTTHAIAGDSVNVEHLIGWKLVVGKHIAFEHAKRLKPGDKLRIQSKSKERQRIHVGDSMLFMYIYIDELEAFDLAK